MPELADWQLARSESVASVLQILDAGVLENRVVLLLDDAHRLLGGPEGEALAAALLSCLNRLQGPAVILATLWDDAYHKLTAPPPSLGDDPHYHSRALLHRAQRVDVPSEFTEDALRSLTTAAAGDPALAEARTTAPIGKITQTLAAGVQLLDRYTSAVHPPHCYSRALVTAAMDATRLGWAGPLPEDFLRDAAPGYLDDDQRAAAEEDWFSGALAVAREKVQRVAAPLEAVPRADGMGRQPGVWRLTDYLDHHGRRLRRGICPPSAFWEAAASHLDSATGLVALANAATNMWRLRHAADLLRKAAESGGCDPLIELGRLALFAGNTAAAHRFQLRAAERGSLDAVLELTSFTKGDLKEQLLQGLADAGDTRAIFRLAVERKQNGDFQGAVALHQRAAELGDTQALHILAGHHKDAGDWQSAETLLRRALTAGESTAVLPLALLLEENGDDEGVERLLFEAGRAGEPQALISLAWRRAEAGEWDTAEAFLHEAAAQGAAETWLCLAEMHEHAGHPEIALDVYRRAAESGESNAMLMYADQRKSAGDMSEAEQWYQRAADCGNSDGLQALVRIRIDGSDFEDAWRLAVLAADAASCPGLWDLAAHEDTERNRLMRRYGLEADGSPPNHGRCRRRAQPGPAGPESVVQLVVSSPSPDFESVAVQHLDVAAEDLCVLRLPGAHQPAHKEAAAAAVGAVVDRDGPRISELGTGEPKGP
ncbi:tetratricopeptide repeat protein [Streptacidiphilus sp. PAMC 29251]